MIRHAVGIDERRAKFRQDLVEKMASSPTRQPSFKLENLFKHRRRESEGGGGDRQNGHGDHQVYQNHPSPRHHRFSGSHERLPSAAGGRNSVASLGTHDTDDDDETAEQDIEEVWFPGAHGDIGGGWDLPDGEEPLSHGPLVWMVSGDISSLSLPSSSISEPPLTVGQVREARRAGVVFDKQRMKENNCWFDEFELEESSLTAPGIPIIEISPDSPVSIPSIIETKATNHAPTNGIIASCPVDSRQYLLNAYTRGRIHDCLCWPEGGLTLAGTLGWRMMEYLPFRRMDLQPDGSWKPIMWPLPRGEVRDIPDTVTIHNSVIRRMNADPNYRPGNLLVGGGGRGVRRAPDSVGTGEWVVLREEGSLVGEVLVKKPRV